MKKVIAIILSALTLLLASCTSFNVIENAPYTDTIIINDTTKAPETEKTVKQPVEKYTGKTGDYSGAKFMSIADTSATAKSVFGGAYYTYKEQYRTAAEKLSAFFDKLTQKLIDGKENAVVSPVNIYMALSLLAECTDGSSRQQILDVIGVDSIEELREQSKILWLYNSRDDEYGRSLLANSIWLSSGLPVKDNCVNTLKNEHYASSFTGDFRDEKYISALKQWLSDQTKGLLDDCINELDIPVETRAALASTLYYKTRWNNEYRETENGVFKGAEREQRCVFNKKTAENVIYKGNGFTAYCERLSDGNEMWFFLPDGDKTVSDVIKEDLVSFTGSNVRGYTYDVTVRMPDFDVGYNKQIRDQIKELGIVDCMGDNSDFSPLTDDNLYVSSIVHAARFKADKEGVEGAAYTVMYLSGGMPVEHSKYDFTLDRPFAFMVINNGVPLFTGVVNEV